MGSLFRMLQIGDFLGQFPQSLPQTMVIGYHLGAKAFPQGAIAEGQPLALEIIQPLLRWAVDGLQPQPHGPDVVVHLGMNPQTVDILPAPLCPLARPKGRSPGHHPAPYPIPCLQHCHLPALALQLVGCH